MSIAVGDRALGHRALLLTFLSLSLSSLDLQDCQIIEKGDLENDIGDFMARPGRGPYLFCPHSLGQNTVDGANLIANKAGESHRLVGQGKNGNNLVNT